jgi:hypothetical protein
MTRYFVSKPTALSAAKPYPFTIVERATMLPIQSFTTSAEAQAHAAVLNVFAK